MSNTVCGLSATARTRSIESVADLEHVISNEPPTRLQRVMSISNKPVLVINEEVSESSRALVRTISSLQEPVVLRHDSVTAMVNIGATAEQGSQPQKNSFRRLTSTQKRSEGIMASVNEEEQAQHPAPARSDACASGASATPLTSISNQQSREKVTADVERIPEAENRTNKMRFLMTPSRKVFESRLQKELKQNYAAVDYDFDGYTLLQERLERLCLLEHEQRGDGNCQFRSISHQLYNTPSWHMSVRKQAVNHMREEAEYFEAFLGEEFETYCDEMGQDGTWGDELTLRAATDSFGLKINVITSEAENWYIAYEPEEVKLNKEIFLSYVSPVHYNSLSRKR